MAVLASETASATAGREGKATSPDGKINLDLSPPGSNGPGTNPEQLFGAGYSACFGGAIRAAAGLEKVRPECQRHQGDGDRESQQGRKRVLPGRDAERRVERRRPGAGRSAVAKAHTICPYSKATRGNIEVKLQANGKAL